MTRWRWIGWLGRRDSPLHLGLQLAQDFPTRVQRSEKQAVRELPANQYSELCNRHRVPESPLAVARRHRKVRVAAARARGWLTLMRGAAPTILRGKGGSSPQRAHVTPTRGPAALAVATDALGCLAFYSTCIPVIVLLWVWGNSVGVSPTASMRRRDFIAAAGSTAVAWPTRAAGVLVCFWDGPRVLRSRHRFWQHSRRRSGREQADARDTSNS